MASEEEFNVEETLEESEETCDIYYEHLLLLEAVTNRSCSMVHELVHNRGMSPDFNVDGQSPICRAAKLGYVDILDILVEGGCSLLVTDADIWRRQALHVAASKGHIDFVKRLLHYGADINSRDDDQRTPLHWASTYGNIDMVRYLVSEGAAVNMAQCDGFTPLHAATCLGHHGVCKVLLDKGAEIDRCDRDGWSAFHTAVCYGHKLVVQTLLDAGASLLKLTSDNENVVHIAASSGRIEILKLLMQSGVNLNERNKDGNTALYLAVFYNEFEMVRFLIQSGADMYISPENGSTPLYLAAFRGYTDHLCVFIEAGYNFSGISWLHNTVFPGLLARNIKMCQLLYRKATNPPSLKDVCKFKIRKCLKYDEQFETRLKGLGLPALLEEFVSYKVMNSIQPLIDRKF
ncbi:hypothetical protein ACF0H5_005258 [Mactra antiquata]